METKGKQKGNMTVKELIKILKEVPNQDARVDLMIPYEKFNDTSNDFCTDNFYVDTIHAQHQDETEYVEIYSLVDMSSFYTPNPNEQRVVSEIKIRENHKPQANERNK
mgnify:CR=1 FL=1|tara:strand:- start:214 stop:537 length:324 start_codon:yes stop_codon:yes gene_type:complete